MTVTCPFSGVTARMPLRDKRQHIQAHWAAGVFYERALMADAWQRYGRRDLRRIYDIGANVGNHTAWFALAWPAATVYAFEPWAESLDHLEETVRVNGLESRVVVDHHAIGDGWGTIHLEPGANEGMTHRAATGRAVSMIPLGGVPYAPPDLIKIDAEGMEMDVLAGAREILLGFHPALYVEGDLSALMAYLAPLGYRWAWTGNLTPTHGFVAG